MLIHWIVEKMNMKNKKKEYFQDMGILFCAIHTKSRSQKS